MEESYKKVARILRTDKDYIGDIEKRFEVVTGKKGMVDKILEENSNLVKDRLLKLGVSSGTDVKTIYDALISKIESDDKNVFELLGQPNCRVGTDCQRIGEVAKKIVKPPTGFFLKLDKAQEFLAKEPPMRVMKALGYKSVEKMLQEEDLLDVYSALRFVEGSEWLNETFFKQYKSLTPDDFEEREIIVKALSEKWGKEAQEFVVKKKHNISHLKELGVVFIIPTLLGISGELLRMLSLILHYLYEIPFYSKLFEDITDNKITFTNNFISLLRGDVIDRHFPDSDRSLWLVVQRYLSKDDESDWRLFVPHINPEAIHWSKAEQHLANLGDVTSEEIDEKVVEDLSFWSDLDWVGDFFKDEIGNDVLMGFNLVDTVMSLVKQKEMERYLYHHQEAFWNHLFVSYFGQDELEKKAREFLLQGYFEV